ncbi:type II secretion system secretin GspD [Caldimonas thermodepolymerans]|uniref:Type II secretion system protein GspD n=1 Tax=Caldimonas thermodepolymerans TaxID=215580 RepID=A0A2S5T626_9BURK|nr:type II secretion system secretin GspD [Caldimonas thermodepolymerans]PPE70453.1 type II secretion system protein GspD [Caldimonas thermodepolymerans]QPC31120.1 type II secretion system secretin GspD [Caldimonas thermodepolymerans]RDH96575.1 type II secretion system protein D (GspD) [Caldimonas thermodepolymerans]
MKLNWPVRLATRLTCSAVAAALAAFPLPGALAQPAAAAAARADASTSQVTLNFVNAEIEGVARAMGVILKRQFVVDPRVKGTMTLYSEQPMSRSDAYLSFLAALRGLGFTVVQVEGLYKIVPEADAKLQTGSVSAGPMPQVRGDQIVTQIFRLNHENANNLVTVLRPLISPNNTINVTPGTNSLVITDYADNLRRLAKIIAALDLPNSTDIEVIPLQHAVASDLAVMVQRLSDLQGAPGAPGAPAGGAQPAAAAAAGGGSGGTILADPRTNSLLVRAPNPARMNMIRSLVQQLDRPGVGGAGGSNIHVVYLKNADAVRLAQVLRAAFAPQGQAGGSGGGGVAAPASTTPAAQTTLTGSSDGSSPQATAPVSGAAQPSTGGFIQADPATNSLIITAPEPLYRQLRAVIDQLDTRRAQVYVESMIVEVNADKAAEFGIQWQSLIGNAGNEYIGGIGTNWGDGGSNILNATRSLLGGAEGLANAELPGNGLNFGVVRKFGRYYTLGLLARALESNTGANILSTPNLITLDNEEAKIVVGENVPFITGQYTNTGTGTTSPFQTIERKDVGLTLRIRPQIGENGTVRLTIFQESSNVIAANVPGTTNAGPATTKRSIESTVVVDDGQIIVLGGLMQDSYEDGRSKVPVLGDLPVLGGLFRSETRTREKRNLMLFLRPVIMRDQEAATRLSLDRYDLIRAQQRETQPSPRLLVPVNEAPLLPPISIPQAPDSATPPQPAGDAAPPPPLTPNTPIER